MEWQANFVRYVLFAPTAINENAGQLFFSVTGQFPQQMQQQPPVGMVAGGPIDNMWASITTQPGRLQIDITPPPPTDMSSGVGGFRALTDIDRGIKVARPIVSKLADGRLINRLAFVVEGVQPMPSADAARERMAGLLPFLDLPPNSTEVMFQLNSPAKASVDGVELNRLCRWGSATLHVLQMEMGAPVPNFIEVGHAASLLVDINTASNRSAPYDPAQVEILFGELEGYATAVLDDGYDALR